MVKERTPYLGPGGLLCLPVLMLPALLFNAMIIYALWSARLI